MIFIKPYIAPPSNSNDFIVSDAYVYPNTFTYVELEIKKYYKFQEMKIANWFEGELYITSVPSKTFCYMQTFPVHVAAGSKLNAEVLDAVKKYSTDEFWKKIDNKVICEYLKHVGVYYGVTLSRDKVNYDTKLTWEIKIV